MNLLFRFLWLIVSWRFRSRAEFWSDVETPFRVLPTDLDPNIHMNNGVYLSIMDLGRFDLVYRSGMMKGLKAKGWYPVVASQSIRYRRSLGVFQKFVLKTRMIGWDDKFFYIQQAFHSKGELAALAIVKGRFLKKSGGGVDPGEIAKMEGVDPVSPKLPDWLLEWNHSDDVAWKEKQPSTKLNER